MYRPSRLAAVPGHGLWIAYPIRSRRFRRGAIRARHALLPWQTITVDTRDLRYGYEAISRHLAGGHPGFPLRDSRRLAPARRRVMRRALSRV